MFQYLQFFRDHIKKAKFEIKKNIFLFLLINLCMCSFHPGFPKENFGY